MTDNQRQQASAQVTLEDQREQLASAKKQRNKLIKTIYRLEHSIKRLELLLRELQK